MNADKTFDARGLLCPMPILKAKEAMQAMAVGQVLLLIADDEGAREDFPSWCNQTGNELVAIEDQPDGSIRIYMKKKA